MKRLILAVIIIVASSGAALAQESPADWVKRLGSGSYPEREKAARMLEQMGKTALPALRDGAGHADLETRRRVILVMERIEDKINSDQVLAPTPIHLRFKSELLSEALGRTSEQMGLPLGARIGADRPINLDTGPIPYWRAWKQFRTAAKLHESDWAVSGGKLRHLEGSVDAIRFSKMDAERDVLLGRALHIFTPRMAFAAEPGAAYAEDDRSSVRVRVRWLGIDKSLQKTGTSAIFAVELRAEPRLEIAALPRVEITKIVDAAGKELPVQAVRTFEPQSDARDALLLAAFSGEIQFGGLLHLKAISWQGAAQPIKELHGRVRLEAIVHATLLEVPGVLKAEGKEERGVDGVTLKVLEADTGDDGQIQLRLRLTHLDSLAPQTDEQKVVRVRPGVIAVRGAMDVAMERLRLRDARGWLHQGAAEYKEVENGCYEASVRFALPPGCPEPFDLVLTKAAKTVTLQMPFEVRDLAAPRIEGK